MNWPDGYPWQFADPTFRAKPEEAEALLDEFLRSLANSANPFMNSPGTMAAQGFKGTPYRFNLAENRKARWDW